VLPNFWGRGLSMVWALDNKADELRAPSRYPMLRTASLLARPSCEVLTLKELHFSNRSGPMPHFFAHVLLLVLVEAACALRPPAWRKKNSATDRLLRSTSFSLYSTTTTTT